MTITAWSILAILRTPAMAVKYFHNLLAVPANRNNRTIYLSGRLFHRRKLFPEQHRRRPADTLLQAYVSLAAGARGLTWYTYYGGDYEYAPVDKTGHRTATWSYLRMVNEQVRALSAHSSLRFKIRACILAGWRGDRICRRCRDRLCGTYLLRRR